MSKDIDSSFGLDVGWVIRNKCESSGHSKTTEAGEGHAAGNEDVKLDRTETPSPKSSTVRISELDKKNPDVTTHVEVLGPNRVVKQRKCSVAADTEENGKTAQLSGHENAQEAYSALRRTQSASAPSSVGEASSKRKSGFFKSLFKRKSASPPPSHSGGSASAESTGPTRITAAEKSQNNSSRLRSKSVSAGSLNGELNGRPQRHGSVSGSKLSSLYAEDDGTQLKRVQTESQASHQSVDPRLEEFIRFYKEHGCNKFPLSNGKDSSPNGKSMSKACFSLDSSLVGNENNDDNANIIKKTDNKTVHLDKRGRPIPPHPPRSRLPPVLKLKHDTPTPASSSHDFNGIPLTGSSKFGSFLKRVTSHTDDSVSSSRRLSAASSFVSIPKDAEESSIESSETPINTSVVPGLEDLKPLKRVAFAANTYFNDPPQQICSRNPRKGEVEVKSDGSVVIHRLTPEEKREILENSSCGIVVGGSGQLKLINHEEVDPSIKEHEGMALKHHVEEEHESQRRHIELAAAEAAAEARAKDAPLDLQRTITNHEEEIGVDTTAKKVTIDKPMISRKKSSTTSLSSMISSDSALMPSEDESEVLPPKNINTPHDIVYTRCCHLREILPIPATMKQLKKGSTDPIPLLQLRNPKPSKVEVLSFSDFLSIAPVMCLSLDGVSLSVEMLRIILSSVTYKDNFEKLTLRNTPLDEMGWKVLSYFVSKCKSLNSLDVTMVPGLPLNVQKPSKSSNNSAVVRMRCNMENRSEMNWNLLSAAVAAKGGLEEMIVSGACMSKFELQNFIDIAWTRTLRLGLAYNSLTMEHCVALASWMADSGVLGVDLGYNDLDGKLGPFISAVEKKNKKGKNIFKFLSLNSTNLSVPKGARSENNDVLNLLNLLCYCDNLKFLDLSNNPGLFRYGMRTITAILPVFVSLLRLHLDYNNLSTTAVMQLAEVLPMCQRLNYISLLGTKLNIISASALAAAVKNSNSIITMDIDYSYVPDKIKEKISVYSMRNTQSELEQLNKKGSGDQHQKLKSLQDELARLLTEDFSSRRDYEYLVANFFDRIQSMRSKLHAAIEELFNLRINGELSTEGKETLIKFCFIDASFERGLKLLAKKSSKGPKPHFRPSPSSGDSPTQDSPTNALPGEVTDSMRRATPLSSSKYAASGHTALLPFHQPSVESYEPADDEVHLTMLSNEVQNEVKQQLREEGDILRKARGFMTELQNSADKRGQEINREVLSKMGDSYDGEHIKEMLLNQDISSVIALLGDMNQKGISVDAIFKKKTDDKKHLASSVSMNDNQSSNTVVGVDANLNDSKADKYSDDDYTSEEEGDEEEMDKAYDEVLDTLVQTRAAAPVIPELKTSLSRTP